ncbi:DUF5060 domain-containing protein [Microbulbifer sp. JMSA002]|uniref:DUF5060 domain-containing protein n=1 Tax=Microbulbifer sp. JMSA002 TaxID=3243368 RepID=UPI0040396339
MNNSSLPLALLITATLAGCGGDSSSEGSDNESPPPSTGSDITDPGNGLAISSFTLVNSQGNSDIFSLTDGAEIYLSQVGSQLNIRANSDQAESVIFELAGAQTHNMTENVSPYALFGDDQGDFNHWTPVVGTYTLTATPYSLDDGAGTAGTSASITFTVKQNDGTDPTDPDPDPTDPPGPVDPDDIGHSEHCTVSGTLEKWHRITITCDDLYASENDDATFTDYRYNVIFTQGDLSYTVPGHFAADGNSANTGATEGTKWRAYFSPPTSGKWFFDISMRQGSQVAVDLDTNAGNAISFDGESGYFPVLQSTAPELDMRSKGLLVHKKGTRYLQHLGDKSVYIEGGMDSPENIFGYSGFDNTEKHYNVNSCKGILHSFEPHLGDWNNGDPTWKDGKGKSLIGLVNYIAEKNVNAIYIMANTESGDGCDAHPWTVYDGNHRAFDVSKLDQWEVAMDHMTSKGMLIHFMTQETENNKVLNNGNLGLERKLYYREMISRFGHHPALQWNMGEESTLSQEQHKAIAKYLKDVDPYDHPTLLHTYGGQWDQHYRPLLGNSNFDGPSIQIDNIPSDANHRNAPYQMSRKWLTESQNNNHLWYVTFTEASGGQAPVPHSEVTQVQRVNWMWGSVMGGGAGFEWYLKNPNSGHAYDLAVENLREFDNHWEQTGHFVKFFNDILQNQLEVNLHSLNVDNEVTSTNNDWVLSDSGNVYLVYLREGGTTNIEIPNEDTYKVYWFNPRSGQLTTGNQLDGIGTHSIGAAPTEANQDWAVVIKAEGINSNVHPDIVKVLPINPNDVLLEPQTNWMDSYSIGDQCFCESTFDHNIADIMVSTDHGTITVKEACDLIGPGPGSAGRPKYNDIQCGNGPANDAGDEDYCPGRVDIGKEGCGHIGPRWNFNKLNPDQPEGDYTEQNGLVIMEAENTNSNLGEWIKKNDIGGHTGSSYLEFNGNTPLNGPPKSPLEYTFNITRSGLYYLHLHAAKENLVYEGEFRTDLANDAYFRLEGNYEAGPNAGNSHGKDAPLELLKKDTKFFGGEHNKFIWESGNKFDPGGHDNKRVAVYKLKAGESYKLVMSGRSQKFKVDRIVFRHIDVSKSDAENINNPETVE